MPSAQWSQFVPPPRPLQGGDQWTVFLSYRSANRAWVMNLYDVLRSYGHKVFLDQCAITAGDELIHQLQNALRTSQAGVLIWSAATQDSTWVRREYEVMERQTDTKPGFRFVPVKLDDAALPEFPSNRIFLDFHAYPDGPNGGELLRLLHSIVGLPLSEDAARFALEQDEASARASAQIAAAVKNGSAARILKLFDAGGVPWESSATLGGKVAEGLTKLGHDQDALEVLQKLEQQFPKAVRPKQLRALALNRRCSKTGSEDDRDEAQQILGELYERGERDPETLGIYGSTWMDRYKRSKDRRDLMQSRDLYLEAFETTRGDFYTGINAAAKSVFLDELARATELAARVHQIVGTEPRPGDYWATATSGEAFLILKNYRDAARLYAAAVAAALREEGSHRSTWAQACALMNALQPSAEDRALIRQAFAHLPDCP